MLAIVAHRTHGTNALLAERGDGLILSPRAALAMLDRGDVAIGRLDVRRSLEGIERGLSSLRRLEDRGVRLLNDADALIAMHDKLVTALRLRAAGVPQPRTGFLPPDANDRGIALPAVVKPRFGSWGRHVHRCTTRKELRACLRGLRQERWFRLQGAIVQELIPPTGTDLRVLVAGAEVIGAVERRAAPGEWRTNISLGGTRLPARAGAKARTLALRAAAAVGADLTGVDLLPVGDDWVVLELNGAVDFNHAYLPAGDVFEAAVSALRRSALARLAA